MTKSLPEDDRKREARREPMVQWFNPLLLAKLGLQVILSALFGRYADQRASQAALDNVDSKTFLKRADMTAAQGNNQKPVLEPDEDGAVWIDYTADLGEGFNSTYAMASLLAQETLEVDGTVLPRGGLLVMGGDEVYPTASRDEYQTRTRTPYEMAFPDVSPAPGKRPRLFAIPGNHDWYDGLEAFHSIFCRARDKEPHHGGLSLGGWRCKQHRSYFALKLTDDWWLWGLDIQLSGYVDQPQVNYFRLMAKELSAKAKVILCTAQPSWLKAAHPGDAEYRSLNYMADRIKEANGDPTVCLLLAGDIHHYSRYIADERGIHFVTAGGGGAFLHPTHQLEPEMDAEWSNKEMKFKLASDAKDANKASCYPSQDVSRKLLGGLKSFVFKNWDFCLGLGAIFGGLAAVTGIGTHNASILSWWSGGGPGFCQAAWDTLTATLGTTLPALVCVVVAAIMIVYADARKKALKVGAGLAHAAAQLLVLISSATFFRVFNGEVFNLAPTGTIADAVFVVEMALTGFLLPGCVWALYLFVTCRFFKMHTNDSFSAMQIEGYKNFVRLRIKGDELTIYPIGLERVPSDAQWQDNPKAAKTSTAPKLVPAHPLKPSFIESPVIVDASGVKRIEESD